ncbi:hypothetical protein AKJ38_02615 [candidate division MSBL1 archaeon SCGC-AAA259I14]|uniref:Glycosyltransferase subfamily 4-like N-terminal domain-containing protein n=1 Tax=candidate division MSBL1 archaeon SCGC-AAA259I14 TaxID=1698268 RepID=A0A133URM5_9EURY|nr:hypothetical protein AKJ38_02615 [candidate division MSBL1 archaeon SCGC-AAA259I14]
MRKKKKRYQVSKETGNFKNKTSRIVIISSGNVISKEGGSSVRTHELASAIAKDNDVMVLESGEEFCKAKFDGDNFNVAGFRKSLLPNLKDLNLFLYLRLYEILTRKRVDLIQVEGCSGIIAAKVVTAVLNKNIPIIYNAHNVEGEKVKNYKDPSHFFLNNFFAFLFIPILELLAVKLSDHVLSVSRRDTRLFCHKYNLELEKISIVPSGAHIADLNSLESREKIRNKYDIEKDEILIVFLGSYDYYPNQEAIGLIKNYIAPEIYKYFEKVKFMIVGKDVPVSENGDIIFAGYVKNLYSFLNASDIAIAPLVSGGGTKIKLFDYMSLGLPIVTTEKGAEGIDIHDGKQVLITERVNGKFLEYIKFLIKDKESRNKLGRNARKLIEKRYNWNKIGKKLCHLYRTLICSGERKE